MPQNFVVPVRDQVMLLAPDMREWLPEGHLAYFVLETVQALDLAGFYAAYRADGHGRAAYDPAMMVGLLLYSYAVGIRSSRAVERRCVEDVPSRVLAGDLAPDYRTISRFRARHETALEGLFEQVLELCFGSGLVASETLAVDGTKIQANAAMRANRTYAQLARQALAEAAATDAAEDEQLGDRRGDELPEQWADPKGRRARIRAALDELEARKQAELDAHEQHLEQRRERERQTGKKLRGRKPKAPDGQISMDASVNLTDPQSRLVRTPTGFCQGYNAQVVAAADQVIVACELTTNSPDSGLLEPMITAARRNLHAAGVPHAPETVLADAGYWKRSQIQALLNDNIQPLVPPTSVPNVRHGLTELMRELLTEPVFAARYRRRQAIIEPIFGQLKHNRAARQFSRRGLTACRSELRLLATTHNLLKLHRAATA